MRRRTNESTLVLWLAAFSFGLGACASYNPAKPPGPQLVTVERVQGPFVLAGTDFDVDFEQTIGAESSRPGDTFVARVQTPVRGRNGQEVIPAGARVVGTVANAPLTDPKALALKFETVETVRGPVAMHAAVESAGRYALVSPVPPELAGPAGAPSVDALLRPRPTAIGGGPPEPGAPLVLAPVRIPARGAVRLTLLDQVVPPGVKVERPPAEFSGTGPHGVFRPLQIHPW
jgi:hypothetical protein